MIQSIKQVLMQRDDLTEAEAEELIAEAQEALLLYLEEGDLDGADNICEEYFSLEPDYLIELI